MLSTAQALCFERAVLSVWLAAVAAHDWGLLLCRPELVPMLHACWFAWRQ